MNENVTEKEIVGLLQEHSELAVLLLRNRYEADCRRIAAEVFLSEEMFAACFDDALHRVWNSFLQDRPQDLSVYVRNAMRCAILRKQERNLKMKQGGMTAELPLLGAILFPESRKTVDLTLRSDAAEQIAAYLDTQPKEIKRVFAARYRQLLSVPEIAEMLSLTPDAVTEMISRLQRDLTERFEKEI